MGPAVEVLDRIQYLEDIEAERRAYRKQPETKPERAASQALRRGGARSAALEGDW